MISDAERHVITAIVDEDQLSIAIGRNGQNVRLASQLIGWQIDLYSSRDWMEREAESVLFGGGSEEYEFADFPLSELEGISPASLAALEAVGVGTFFDVLDMDQEDFLEVPGIDAEEAERLEGLIDELTVVDEGTTGLTLDLSSAVAEIGGDETSGEASGEAADGGDDGEDSGTAEDDDASAVAVSTEGSEEESEDEPAGD